MDTVIFIVTAIITNNSIRICIVECYSRSPIVSAYVINYQICRTLIQAYTSIEVVAARIIPNSIQIGPDELDTIGVTKACVLCNVDVSTTPFYTNALGVVITDIASNPAVI